MKTIIIRKKILIFFVCGLLISAFLLFALPRITSTASVPSNNYTIVLDAGHGGIDGGCVGKISKQDENHLNLAYAKSLEKYLTAFGVNVVMTRKDLNGLYNIAAPNKKKDDMKKRKEIIEDCKADMIISIHMNSYPSGKSRGAQVFYKKDDNGGKVLATSLQKEFISGLESARKTPEVGDYFILNCTDKPSVIVECGFLSNKEEEALLITSEYREKVTYAIFCGIVKFLGQ